MQFMRLIGICLGTGFLIAVAVNQGLAAAHKMADRVPEIFINSGLQESHLKEKSVEKLCELLDERIDYHKRVSATGQGIIIPAGSTMIVLGDLKGDYNALKGHFVDSIKKGYINEKYQLKSNCYLIALGNYGGQGGHSQEIITLLLTVQQRNPGRVFLLHGDAEDLASAKELKNDWLAPYSGSQKSVYLAELAWLKLALLFKLMPRVLVAGLRFPSTHSYDIVLFCHKVPDEGSFSPEFIDSLLESHINSRYKTPFLLNYRKTSARCDDKKPTSTTMLAEFVKFIKKFGSKGTASSWYQYCICALIKGSQPTLDGIMRSADLVRWKSLKWGKRYEIEGKCQVISCSSGSLSKPSYGIVEARDNGRWSFMAQS